ncbi:MAG: UDP-3-O-[3-hydroxymyristoyl] N-acetylglucosamine deacetylase [SAR324 cluster bacterium]|uniref:UDP-3-O-acyl-N-acetylglucosamine deacetylase n=1 Tax=SAR324 cluster bacterium TaxID=2024889 RepID=A0A7X9FSK4_9DELT|nr:UDP-3-O-[3-hydroxymyristoyl] N-acetylglucosamine deacetylase [SAR324 cluster bacterium]
MQSGDLASGAGKRILVVDDEAAICRTLENVLSDEGFSVSSVDDGYKALSFISKNDVVLVILDIWMSGMDGIETLVAIKEKWPKLPVIMISGHTTIAAAIKATKLGATDFIEKPIDLDVLLRSVRMALSDERQEGSGGPSSNRTESTSILEIGGEADLAKINNVVFRSSQRMRGRKIGQKTLVHSAILYGQGLHSGKKSGLILEPLPPNSGIHFVGISGSIPVPAHLDFVDSTGFATTLKLEDTQAGTIEHIMSALHAYGITNLLVKCNSEVPVMDGSAVDFCSLIEETGIEEQEGEHYAILIDKVLRYGKDNEFIQIEPSENFVIDYTLNYPSPLGLQHLVFQFEENGSFHREIAPARTFGFVKDISFLQKQGLALGGRFDNFVLFGDEGPINCELRFPDEAVRHKILDVIGDLYLLGRPLQGKVTACMTGHSDNIGLLKLISEELNKE